MKLNSFTLFFSLIFNEQRILGIHISRHYAYKIKLKLCLPYINNMMVGVSGFEPETSSLSETRSNQLSYTP